jgi:hypothetical protein
MRLRLEQVDVLLALEELTRPDGEMCVPFAPLMTYARADRKTVRRICRYLARRGLAEYHRALWTEDGEPAGAGYCITKAGIEKLQAIYASCVCGAPDGQHYAGCSVLLMAENARLTAEVERLREEIVGRQAHDRIQVRHIKDLTARVSHLEEAITRIARMKLYPDDVINRMTLLAAIEIASAALSQPTPMEKTA